METFNEIPYRTERDTLSAPLPETLTHPLHAAKPEYARERVGRLNAAAFLDRVQASVDLSRADARAVTAAVLAALKEATDTAALDDLANTLLPSYGKIFLLCPIPTPTRRNDRCSGITGDELELCPSCCSVK